ncbi:BadF/BadG/BcrA/BcrD ATPase family protein [Planctobacterium marinum]|uniref:BadF/BadG/BcrA/BcrD ATPase family protein n=1 Tax=Planctobacterium marinum TaxID=1631968 RepID=UPI0030C663F1
MTNRPTLYLGVDGGGSKCRAIIQDAQGKTLGTGLSGAANLLRGTQKAQESVLAAYLQAREEAGLDKSDDSRVIAGLGLAGANLETLSEEFITTWQHPFKAAYLTTDLEIACLGAHKGKAGGVIIIGTGSCGLVASDNGSLTLGGHGFLLGDKGSGAWFGLSAVQYCLEALSGLQPDSKLVAAIQEFTGCENEQALITRFADAAPKEFAALAPLVFLQAERGDRAAANIIQSGVGYIASLCTKLLSKAPPRFSLIGGLAPLIAEHLPSELAKQISPPLSEPEEGAVLYARQCAQSFNIHDVASANEAHSVT